MTSPTDQWPPEGCPPLAWPELPNDAARVAWYGAVIRAYEELHDEAKVAPVSDDEVAKLEQRLGCTLPSSLCRYHKTFGATELGERLCSVEGAYSIQPLLEAYPGLVDIAEDEVDGDQLLVVAEMLVAFGDYLGNGNKFCFHKETGEVYYFDHDDGAPLTLFFPDVEQYLNALMIRSLTEIYAADSEGEALLVQRFGQPLVRKWLY